MLSPGTVTLVSLLYFVLLFLIAFVMDKLRAKGSSQINAHIYSLSIAVYCTTWTFYGSVGRAATSGLDYLTIYLGPTLIAFTWWFLIRKMVRIRHELNIVSIADFISSRYGQSLAMGALVTLFSVVGIMPYIALQLKAVSYTFDLLVPNSDLFYENIGASIPIIGPFLNTALISAAILALFGIIFGARLDTTLRHDGLVTMIAFESVIKFLAFIAVGIFVTFGLFDGMEDVITRFLKEFPEKASLLLIDNNSISYSHWFAMLFMSISAVLFLPRQFHILVIENTDEQHIKKAMWLFPAYLFGITFFVLPIALGGIILNGGDVSQADYFVLLLPLQSGHPWLALFVFIGGLSAAAGMILISSVALTTMIHNYWVMPIMQRLNVEKNSLPSLLLWIKRIGIIAVIGLGYLYCIVIGDSYALVNIGLISFVAAAQFAPSIIAGIYWRTANKAGAMTGLLLGFITWSYTLLIPSFVRSGWLDASILEQGLFGFPFLQPLALFGLDCFDIWTHSLFWTMLVNCGALVSISLLTTASEIETEQMQKFVDIFNIKDIHPQRQRISRAPSVMEFVELMAKFIGEKQAHQAIASYIDNQEIDARGGISEFDLPNLKEFAERTLAGSVGAAPARIILENYLSARGSQMENVFDIFASVNLSRRASKEQLGVLYEAARVVSSKSDLQTILDNLLRLLMQQFMFDLMVIRIYDPEKQALTVQSQHGISSALVGEIERQISMDTYIGESFLTNSTLVVNDTDFMESNKPRSALLIHQEGITSFAHTPIQIEDAPIGVLSAFSRTSKGIFTDEFKDLFQSIGAQIGVAWRNAEQTRNLIEAKKQEQELKIATRIQSSLLPRVEPDIPRITLKGKCVTAQQVGGDYYDYIQRSETSIDIVIADVSGHNVGAALLMAEARTFIKSNYSNIDNCGDMLSALNTFFYEDLTLSELFITMFYMNLNTETGVLTYSNAGHPPTMLLRNNGERCEQLDGEGLILGIKPQVDFEVQQTTIAPGDVLFLYTDGITEAESMDGEFYGDSRLCSTLRSVRNLEPREIIDHVLNSGLEFSDRESFNDDISLVALKYIEG